MKRKKKGMAKSKGLMSHGQVSVVSPPREESAVHVCKSYKHTTTQRPYRLLPPDNYWPDSWLLHVAEMRGKHI